MKLVVQDERLTSSMLLAINNGGPFIPKEARSALEQFSRLPPSGKIFSTVEGFNVLKGAVGVNDIAFISAITGSSKGQTPEQAKVDTQKLHDTLEGAGYGVFRVFGHYEGRDKATKETTFGGNEPSFGVINAEGRDTLSFFQIIISLGKHYNQANVALVPALDTRMGDAILRSGRMYWFYTTGDDAGQIVDKGTLDQAGVEEWAEDGSVEVTGYSRFSGTKDKYVFRKHADDLNLDDDRQTVIEKLLRSSRLVYDFSHTSTYRAMQWAFRAMDVRSRLCKEAGVSLSIKSKRLNWANYDSFPDEKSFNRVVREVEELWNRGRSKSEILAILEVRFDMSEVEAWDFFNDVITARQRKK